jgi:Tol biopolymer transport system component
LLQTWEETPGVHYSLVGVADWSRDGRQIVLVTETQDAAHHTSWQIVLLDAKNGMQRTVISRDGSATRSRLSPDGKFLAYELAGVKPDKQNDIAVVPVAGGQEKRVVVDPASEVLLGWSPDGRNILFTSDRTGERGLYAIPFINGSTQGAPRLLKRNFNANAYVGVLGAGQLLYEIHGDDPSAIRGDVKFASYDFASERFVEPPVVAFRDTAGRNSSADWSPDGRYVVSLSARADPVLTIHSADGDYVRELRSGLKLDPGSPWPRWMPDGKAVAVPATDGAGRQGIYRVKAQTGVASPLVLSQEGERLNGPAFSRDGTKLVYNRILTRPTADGTATGASGSVQPRVIMERDLEHGRDRELMRGNLGAVLVSPDGRYFTTARSGSDGCSILVVPAGGGDAKDVMHAATPCRLWVEMWAPDSRSIFVADTPEPLHQFWRVSISDGARHSVNLDTNMGLSVRVHPDGRRLVYSVEAERTRTEIWVLENVLSALDSKK